MSQEDPFSLPEGDRTIIMPTPGRRSAQTQRAAPASPRMDDSLPDDPPADTGGLNPLVAAANPLLDIVPQLRASLEHPNPAGLRDFLVRGIRAFEARAQAAGTSPEKVIAARYVLCTVLDETAAATPWGASGAWARHSLLVMFHNEAWGGEKFFQLLSRLAEKPAANRDLLELMYVCLSLGFKGRYQVADNGRAALDTLRERLARMLRSEQGEYERSLSPHWQGVAVTRRTLLSALPLWIAAGVLGLIALGAYFGISYALNEKSDPVFAGIQSLGIGAARPALPAQAPERARQGAEPRLAGLLDPEIRQGLVSVQDEAKRSIVTIRGDGLFPPGSATVSPAYLGPLRQVARALDAQSGPVRVVGHTDKQPIRSARFPSNWHLSEERARAVMDLLRQSSRSPARFSAEGHGDTEPLAPGDTPAQRAQNRRVDIILAVPGPGG
jgi:type VI secretion system protein ImpK